MSDFRNAFFERYAAAAIEEQKRYGIPASVTLAQMAVESGYGESSLAKQDNNYFGIKASKSWLNAGKPWSYHHDDHYNDKFCTFASPLESLEYHSKVLMANRYKACFQYNSDDHYHWISGIKAGGYATDPHYVAKIEKVIKDYGLERFMDKVICVYLSLDERLARLKERDHADDSELLARIHNQMPAEEMMRRADYVILNYEGNPRRRQVAYIDKQLRIKN